MKIAIIIEKADIALGGAERSVTELAAQLRQLGAEVKMLVAKGNMDDDNYRFLCNDVRGKRVSYAVFNEALKKHLAENKYDIVHSILPFSFADVYQPRSGNFTEAIIQNAASYRNEFLFKWKIHTHFFHQRRYQWLKAEKQLCKSGNKTIIANLSNYTKLQYIKHYKVDQSRLVIIHNGVKLCSDVSQEAIDKMRSRILTQLKLKEADKPVFFLFGGNDFKRKGLDCTIEALGELGKSNAQNNAYLIVAGSGNYSKYNRLAKKYQVQNKVLFMGKLKDAQTVLRAADVNILPTFYDPASRIILEGLTAAVPAITTANNGAADQFENGKHGIVVDKPENITAIAQAMEHYLSRENLIASKNAIIEDRLKEKISIERHCRELLELYEKIISGDYNSKY